MSRKLRFQFSGVSTCVPYSIDPAQKVEVAEDVTDMKSVIKRFITTGEVIQTPDSKPVYQFEDPTDKNGNSIDLFDEGAFDDTPDAFPEYQDLDELESTTETLDKRTKSALNYARSLKQQIMADVHKTANEKNQSLNNPVAQP